MVKIHFEVPDERWSQLVAASEASAVPLGALMSRAADDVILRSRPMADTREARVVAMVRSGMTDGEVSRRTGETRQYVATVRRRAGIPANREIRRAA